jgi:hypothetical protein
MLSGEAVLNIRESFNFELPESRAWKVRQETLGARSFILGVDRSPGIDRRGLNPLRPGGADRGRRVWDADDALVGSEFESDE